MSELLLRIDKYLTGPGSQPPKVYAKIYALGEGAKRVPGGRVRQELVPISSAAQNVARLNVEPGHYYVETVLPSGEILADDVLVEAGKSTELVLRGDHSPHEWLSWQHLTGNVPDKQVFELQQEQVRARRSASAGSRGVAPGRITGGAKRGGGSKGGSGAGGTIRGKRSQDGIPLRGSPRGSVRAESAAAALAAPEVKLGSPIMWLSRPHSLLNEVVPGGPGVWGWLAGLKGTGPQDLVRRLNGGLAPVPVKPGAHDATHAVYHVASANDGGAQGFKGKTRETPRHFVAVPRRDSVELLSLPLPWNVVQTNRAADVEIVVQEPTEPAGFCSSAIVRDEVFGMLLAYLSSGALPTARQMAETAKGMLYFKVTNPYAAAAGGYALVGTATQAVKRDWHTWVSNLMKWFEHIPDGAIQWGYLRMRMRRSQSDVDEARDAFKLAYRRGLPFYSMGLRWLLDGLEMVSQEDDEAAEMLKNVRQVAWRANYQQPFTILRVGGE